LAVNLFGAYLSVDLTLPAIYFYCLFLPTHVSKEILCFSPHSYKLKDAVRIAETVKHVTRVLLLGTVAVVALSLLAISPQPAHATTPSLTIGQIQVFDPAGCPGTGWYSYTSSNGTQYNMVCQAANIYNCPNAAPLGFTFGYLSPSAGDEDGVASCRE
jgi:hypothetical protein